MPCRTQQGLVPGGPWEAGSSSKYSQWLCCLSAGGRGVTRPISNVIGELESRTAENQEPQGAVSRASEVRGRLPSAKPGKVSCRCGARSAPKASLEQVLKGGGSDRGAPLCAPGLQCPETLQLDGFAPAAHLKRFR